MYKKRLRKEYRDILKKPIPNILAKPDPKEILHWYFVFYDFPHFWPSVGEPTLFLTLFKPFFSIPFIHFEAVPKHRKFALLLLWQPFLA